MLPKPLEHTLVILKPDAVKRRLIGPILTRFEQKGLVITAMELCSPPASLIDQHYIEHVNKQFYPNFRNYMLSGPIVKLIVSGHNVVKEVRRMIGGTNPQDAELGSIRGDYGMDKGRNLVHGSDSKPSATREIELWFGGWTDVNQFDYELIYEQ